MRIATLYQKPEPTVSFEFFPPKTAESEETLFKETVPKLVKLGPSFTSVTYGAGGGTRATTLRVVNRIRTEFSVESMAHLTCVGSTRDMLGDVLDEAHSLGIENILALRGDPPKGETEFKAVEGGFSYSTDLISFVKSRGQFGIGAACYPEGHVQCGEKQTDWDRAVQKVETGAEFLITQLFYDINDFFEMDDYLRNKRKLNVPIIPGVLPFLSTEQIKRFCSMCGANLSDELIKKLDELASDNESVRKFGVEYCSEMCRKLLDYGVPGIHFYCLNRSASVTEIIQNLGL